MALLQPDPKSETRAEVMRLHYLEGLSIRAVAKRLSVSRKTVRKHLGGGEIAPVIQKASRPSLLDSYHQMVQTWLTEAPELRAPPGSRAAPQARLHGWPHHRARSRLSWIGL